MSSSEEENFNIDISDDESEEDYAPVVKKKATTTVRSSISATKGEWVHLFFYSRHRRMARRLPRSRLRRNPQQSLRRRRRPLSQTRMTMLYRTRRCPRTVALTPPVVYERYQKDPRRPPRRSTPRFEALSFVLCTADHLL